MTDIVWEDLPRRSVGSKRRGGVWPGRLAPLRERPYQWARVHGPIKASQASATASNLRAGKLVDIDPSEYEFASRTVDGEGFLYARFIGNGTTP